jgi:energy-coupling factor transporter transmembrane protein EcfT
MVDFRTDTQEARSRRRVITALLVGSGALVASLVLRWPGVLAPAAVAVATLLLLDRRQVHAMFNKWLWLALAIAVILPVWLLGAASDEYPRHLGGARLARLAVGITMALRIVTTLASLLLIGSCISPLAMNRAIGRLLGKDLALACAIGVNLLPSVLEILRRTTLALRLRGGFKRHRLANVKRLVTAVGVQTVRLTEDVAEALVLAQAARHREDGAPVEGRPVHATQRPTTVADD